jgi:RNA polymerase sigma-70 factor (ECF subfamily)
LPLRAWLRAVAVRAALNLRRGKAGEPHDAVESEDGRLVASAGANPELRLAKAHHKAAVEDAVRAAVARLSPRERTLLRLHLVEGLSVDRLGAHYQVGRSTAARWLASARDALRDHTRAEIAARLGPAETGDVAAFVRSQLELSALGLLGEAG